MKNVVQTGRYTIWERGEGGGGRVREIVECFHHRSGLIKAENNKLIGTTEWCEKCSWRLILLLIMLLNLLTSFPTIFISSFYLPCIFAWLWTGPYHTTDQWLVIDHSVKSVNNYKTTVLGEQYFSNEKLKTFGQVVRCPKHITIAFKVKIFLSTSLQVRALNLIWIYFAHHVWALFILFPLKVKTMSASMVCIK